MTTHIPSDCKGFLCNDENKKELFSATEDTGEERDLQHSWREYTIVYKQNRNGNYFMHA